MKKMRQKTCGSSRKPAQPQALGQVRDRPTTRAVILAAGRGRRMGALTEDRPKCLLPVGGQTILEHQLATLSALGVTEITVVTGYCSDRVRERIDGRARFIQNDDWAETNSLYSFSLCHDAAECESLLVLNGDVIAHPAIIERVLTSRSSAFAYDSTSGNDEEHMKVELRGDQLRSMSKDLPRGRVHGENVGVLRFEGRAPALLSQEAESLLSTAGRKQWLAAAVQRVAQQISLQGLDVDDLPWCEIDFPEDLRAARALIWPALCAQPWAPSAATDSQPSRGLPTA